MYVRVSFTSYVSLKEKGQYDHLLFSSFLLYLSHPHSLPLLLSLSHPHSIPLLLSLTPSPSRSPPLYLPDPHSFTPSLPPSLALSRALQIDGPVHRIEEQEGRHVEGPGPSLQPRLDPRPVLLRPLAARDVAVASVGGLWGGGISI